MRNAFSNLPSWVKQPIGVIVVLSIELAVSLLLICVFWEWLAGGGSVPLRNVGLMVGAVLALTLAVWRSSIAHDQNQATQEQIATAQQQAQTATDGLRHGRYQEAANMLGNTNLATRLGGLYALERLGREAPDEYHVQIMKLLGAFVRHADDRSNRLIDETEPPPASNRCRFDVETAAQIVGGRDNRQVRAEEQFMEDVNGEQETATRFSVDLSKADLREAMLANANLSDSLLGGADLTGAGLFDAQMERCNLERADLSGAVLMNANLKDTRSSRAKFVGAELPDANLSSASLICADLTKAVLPGADLSNSIMSHSQLRCAELTQAKLPKADLSGANLANAKLNLAVLTHARLDQADLRGANLRCAELQQARLTGADLSDTDLTGADLTKAILREADLNGACLNNAKLCDVMGLTQATLDSAWETTTKAPDLRGALCLNTNTQLTWKPKPSS